jgi:hypothetical protein
MSVRRKLVFNGTLRSDRINQTEVFNEGDLILLEVSGLADNEFIEMAGSLNVRVRQGVTADPCDDPIPIPEYVAQSLPVLPPASREIFDMGDYEYPLDIPVFNSYSLVRIDYELSQCALDMSVILLPSFDVTCKVWVLWQEKGIRNLYRYVCENALKDDVRWTLLAANILATNAALAYNVSALATILAVPTGGTSVTLASPVLVGLALSSAGIATQFSLPNPGIPSLLPT